MSRGAISNSQDHSAVVAPLRPRLRRTCAIAAMALVAAGIAVEMAAARTGSFGFAAAGAALVLAGCLSLLAVAALLWADLRGRYRLCDAAMSAIEWRGDERVLEVGDGSGLMLLAALRRSPTVHGAGAITSGAGAAIDGLAAHARDAGVADRVAAVRADAGRLPFDDGAFDIVCSAWDARIVGADHDAAVVEMVRVAKPQGWLAVVNFGDMRRTVTLLRALGCADVRCSRPNFMYLAPTRVVVARTERMV